MVHQIFITILILVVVFVIYLALMVFLLFRPPEDNPREILEELEEGKIEDKPMIVFIGDSITHGNMSVNYVDMVKDALGPDRFLYVNAGINADTTYDVLLRLDDVIALKPEFVTILIGTNDVLQSLGLSPLKIIRDILKHATYDTPTKESFRKNLEIIVQRLLNETDAAIALCSLPIISEVPDSRPFQEAITFSNIIHAIAEKYNLHYLPVNERMREYLAQHPSNPKITLTPKHVERVYLREILLRDSFDEISEELGFSLLVDNIHLNSKAAKIVADLIAEFIVIKVSTH